MFYNDTKTIIAVYKDELLANQLKKMVETKRDMLGVIPWSEKFWLANKKDGKIDDKILFIGDIKGMEALVPLIDVQYEKYGIKYGWAGKQAVIIADPKGIQEKEVYEEFLGKLNELSVPEIIKTNYYIDTQEQQTKNEFFKNAWLNIKKTFKASFSDYAAVKRQMLFYGIIQFYNNHLEQFVQ